MFEQAVRIPLVMVDPASDVQGGSVCSSLVQAIDLIPTFLDALNQPEQGHVLEGASLMPCIRSGQEITREAVFCELDYSFSEARHALGVPPDKARSVMVRTKDKKLIHHDGFAPQLYDLVNDPQELNDLGANASMEKCREELHDRLFEWMRELRNRTTMSSDNVLHFAERAKTSDLAIGKW